MARTKRTRIKKNGNGMKIDFSKKDGKALADHLNNGGSLLDLLTGKWPPNDDELEGNDA